MQVKKCRSFVQFKKLLFSVVVAILKEKEKLLNIILKKGWSII